MERSEVILALKHELHQADYFEQDHREIGVDVLRACLDYLLDDDYWSENGVDSRETEKN